jgi:hypothetical protein
MKYLIILIFMLSFAAANEDEIYFDDLQQIVNYLDGNQTYGNVRMEPLRTRILTTMKRYELREKEPWRP